MDAKCPQCKATGNSGGVQPRSYLSRMDALAHPTSAEESAQLIVVTNWGAEIERRLASIKR